MERGGIGVHGVGVRSHRKPDGGAQPGFIERAEAIAESATESLNAQQFGRPSPSEVEIRNVPESPYAERLAHS